MGPVILAVALVTYNTAINFWPPFQRDAYLPLNFLMTGAVLAIGVRGFGLSANEIGLRWTGTGAGALLGLAIGAPLFLLLAHPHGRRILIDRRLAGISGKRALYTVLLRIPLGTALPEELAFRGVLCASARASSVAAAVVLSSVAFGLWHLTPTRNLARVNRVPRQRTPMLVAGGVILTGAAGAGFAWLRLATGSVVAPMILHAMINSLSAGASILADRLRPLPSSDADTG